MKKLRIKDILSPMYGVFQAMDVSTVDESLLPEIMDIDFVAKYGERLASPLLRVFVSNDTISNENLDKLAFYLQRKYQESWSRYANIANAEYDPLETIGMTEKETTRSDLTSNEELSSTSKKSAGSTVSNSSNSTFTKSGEITRNSIRDLKATTNETSDGSFKSNYSDTLSKTGKILETDNVTDQGDEKLISKVTENGTTTGNNFSDTKGTSSLNKSQSPDYMETETTTFTPGTTEKEWVEGSVEQSFTKNGSEVTSFDGVKLSTTSSEDSGSEKTTKSGSNVSTVTESQNGYGSTSLYPTSSTRTTDSPDETTQSTKSDSVDSTTRDTFDDYTESKLYNNYRETTITSDNTTHHRGYMDGSKDETRKNFHLEGFKSEDAESSEHTSSNEFHTTDSITDQNDTTTRNNTRAGEKTTSFSDYKESTSGNKNDTTSGRINGSSTDTGTVKDAETYKDYLETQKASGSSTREDSETDETSGDKTNTSQGNVERIKEMSGDMGVSQSSDLLRKEYAFWSEWNLTDAIMLDVANELGLKVLRIEDENYGL